MIAIIDYGMGNLRSVQKGFEKAGHPAFITADPQEAAESSAVVLPGVGAFADAMKNFTRGGFVDAIKQILRDGKPLLGICLGMQMLFQESEENGRHRGLGIFPGKVVKFALPGAMKVPHMGWNQVKIVNSCNCPVLRDIPDGTYFYFVHSYYVAPADDGLVGGVTNYGLDFASVVGREKVFGIQFHPEKSSDLGLKILKNFGELVRNDYHPGN